jgi:hypothetical protein
MIKKSRTDSSNRPAATSYRDPNSFNPRPPDFNPFGDSETIRRYRQFFQTHDLHGLSRRDGNQNRSGQEGGRKCSKGEAARSRTSALPIASLQPDTLSIVRGIQAAGITSIRGIVTALNARGIRTARWQDLACDNGGEPTNAHLGVAENPSPRFVR